MEGRVGSGVLKKKNSSGCLIIKKTGANKNSGVGLGGLGDGSKGKKRARLIASGSDSSSSSSDDDDDESLEFMRRKVNEKRLKKGSAGYKRNELENRGHDRDNAGIDVSAEKKRSRLDLFEFDEYDEFDGKKMKNEFLQDRFKRVGRDDGGNVKESSVNPNRNLVDKRKQGSFLNGSSSGRSKNVGGSGTRNKGFESEDDEAHMPISLLKMKYQETAGESIRLQGKNGVLKVMVNKKKKLDFSSQHKNLDPGGKDLSAELPVFSDSKTSKNRGLLVGKGRSAEKEKGEIKIEKVNPKSNKNKKARDSDVDETDTVLKLATPGPQASSSKKAVKKEAEMSPSTEIFPSVKGKEGNAKRGGSTEKQMLREKIRGMLIDAGWSIDYRPRRNRDYLDAVYISPSGTAYWSIIKAYDAFKKHLAEDNDTVKAKVGSPSFAPLSEDLINKLTRQTKKKIAEEMRRKRKEDSMTRSAKKPVVNEAEESSDSDQSEERLSSYVKQNQKLRGKLSKVDQDSDDDSSDDSVDRRPRKVKFEKSSTASKSNSIQGRTSKVIGRCTLLVRGSDRGDNSGFDGYVPYRGKRTVLAWLINSGTAKLSEKVQYMNRRRTKVMLEGWITRDGIHCGCCSKILTVSKFELHAGSKLRQPFQNIFLESGSSLLQCQIDAWNSQDESLHRDFFTVDVDGDDPDDDTCAICGDGGDLICCDSCPSTFHQICLGIQMLPSGDWHCPNCICKFCGLATAEENDISCDEFNKCNFCEKKYHKSCSERAHPQPVSSCSASFCGLKCQEIYDHLQKILGVKHELEAGISWSIIQRTDISDASLRGFHLRAECNSKLAVALSVMDECFLPIIDRRSGINIIHNVVYNCGSNFNRLNYRGFYTAVLERGDEILAAASIRLHGDRLAEMPFIGTREIYRRQGMCRRLLSALETELCSLKVGQLIIPAISEHMNTWTTIFGFHELDDIHKKEIKSMNMLVFPGTDMLQKELVKQENSDGVVASESTKNQLSSFALVEKSEASLSEEENKRTSSDSESTKNQTPSPALVEKSEASLSEEENKRTSSNSGGIPTSKSCDEVDALDSGSSVPAIPSDALQETDIPAPNNTSDAVCESVNLKCSPNPAEEGNICSEEHESLEPSNSLVKAVVKDACEIEDCGTLNSADAPAIETGSPASSENATDDAACSKTVSSNGCVEPFEPFPASISEASAEVNNEASNGDKKERVVVSNADSDHKAFEGNGVDSGVVQEAPDRAETDKPDSDHKAFDGDDVDLDVVRDTPDRAKIDKPDSEYKAFEGDVVGPGVTQYTPDRAETDPDSDHRSFEGDCVDQRIVQDTPDRAETDEPDSDHKAFEGDGLGVIQDTPNHAETDERDSDHKAFEGDGVDPGVIQDTPDCAEIDKPDSDRKAFGGEVVDPGIVRDTPDRAETDEPNSDHKAFEGDGVDLGVVQDTPDRAETNEPSGESKRSPPISPCQTSPQNAAATENHVR